MPIIPQAPPADWQIKAERTQFQETSRYEETIAYCRRLDEASDQAKLVPIGTSPQGRTIYVMLLTKDENFLPSGMARKPFLFFNNGIHSGEIEGKDASLMLMRDILVTKTKASLLDNANLAFCPIFSVDGHERFTPFSRINQNGPSEMGWRTTATNLNLNRDWVKADAPEMKALLGWLTDYKPDVLYDNHTTDGGDHQYVMTHDTARWPVIDEQVMDWADGFDHHLLHSVPKAGFKSAPYFSSINYQNPAQGASLTTYSPRFSHGYYALKNRVAVLVETHVLKPYEPRVKSTYAIMEEGIRYASENARSLKDAIRLADMRDRQIEPGSEHPISARTSNVWRDWTFLGKEYEPYQSEVTGGTVRSWGADREWASRLRDRFEVADSVTAPFAYLIPPQWEDAIDLLRLHGFELEPLAPGDYQAQVTRFSDVSFANAPFESRFMPSFQMSRKMETVSMPQGSVLVRAAQPNLPLLLHMMEPQAPDSLIKWGFFNQIFVRTEYYGDYAMEPIAREMLKDPEIKAAYEEALKDPEFAASPGRRLNWFYERSPYYDQTYNVYPIVRLMEPPTTAKSL